MRFERRRGLARVRRSIARLLRRSIRFLRWSWACCLLALRFAVELVQANWAVAAHVVSFRQRFETAVLALPLQLSHTNDVVLYASLLTLTPGVVALGWPRSGNRLYVHTLDARDVDAVLRSARRLELRIVEVRRWT